MISVCMVCAYSSSTRDASALRPWYLYAWYLLIAAVTDPRDRSLCSTLYAWYVLIAVATDPRHRSPCSTLYAWYVLIAAATDSRHRSPCSTLYAWYLLIAAAHETQHCCRRDVYIFAYGKSARDASALRPWYLYA